MNDNTIEFQVSGKIALFSDPITRVGGEKTTYLVPTYEAIKGICNSIYWKPTFIWVVDEIRVMNPIQTRERGIRKLVYNGDFTKNKHTERSIYLYLKDVAYQVRAHLKWNENREEFANDRKLKKHMDIARRSIAKGGRLDVFLGTRECQAYVEPCVFGEGKGAYDEIQEMGFGMMYHGITYPDEAYMQVPATYGAMHTRFSRISMKNGVIKYPKPWDCIHRFVRPMKKKVFENNEYTEVEKGTA